MYVPAAAVRVLNLVAAHLAVVAAHLAVVAAHGKHAAQAEIQSLQIAVLA
jgi:hypothetical protein